MAVRKGGLSGSLSALHHRHTTLAPHTTEGLAFADQVMGLKQHAADPLRAAHPARAARKGLPTADLGATAPAFEALGQPVPWLVR